MSLIHRLRPSAAPCIRIVRHLTTSTRLHQSPVPYTTTCPSPTCACASAPPDLDIDRKTPLLNTMAPYAEQVVVCTGKDDWSSRIEDEEGDAGEFIRGLRQVIGKGGEGFDPFNTVLGTASSFPASEKKDSTSVMLFPSFKRFTSLPSTPSTIPNFATAYLKARHLHSMHDSLAPSQRAKLTRDESIATQLPAPEPITNPVVLICGHGGRDERCGIIGPILRTGFQAEFARRGIEADVGLISHIGGHKYAGNVIIYIPPTLQSSPLKGSGIWYGRIGPENVEGVVEETVVQGRVITDLFRGGIRQDGANLGRLLEGQIKKERGDDGGEQGALGLKPRAR